MHAGKVPAAIAVLVGGLAVGVAGAAQQGAFKVGRKRPAIAPTAFRVTSPVPVAPLRPGTSQALDLRLTNAHRHGLAVMWLTVGIVVDYAHVRDGCNRRRDFRSIPMPPSSYPIRLGPRRSVSLRRLGVRVLPRIAMVARPRNQDACKGARLMLTFGGRAGRTGAGSRR